MTTRPRLQALVLADHIYTDTTTKKHVIAGTFSCLWSPTFPAFFGREVYAFVSLTDLRKPANMKLRLVDLADLSVVAESSSVRIESPQNNPSHTVEVVTQVPPLPMPHPGAYAFEVHCDDEKIGEVKVQMAQATGT